MVILTPEGKHLGTLITTKATSNCTFGGTDGSWLYITVDMYLVRVKTLAKGLGL